MALIGPSGEPLGIRGFQDEQPDATYTAREKLMAQLAARGIQVGERGYREPETGAPVEPVRMFEV